MITDNIDFRDNWRRRDKFRVPSTPPFNPTDTRMPIMPPNEELASLPETQQPIAAPSFDVNEQLRRGQEFQQAQGYGQPDLPVIAPSNNYPDSPEVVPDQRDPRQQAWDEYQQLLGSRPKKEKPWKEAIYLGLQALDKIFSDRPSEQPIRLLRDVQYDKNVTKAGQKVGVIEARQKAEQEAAYRKKQLENIDTDNTNAANTAKRLDREAKLGRWDFLYQQSDEFDPTDPKNAEIVAQMRADNYPVFTKKKGETWQRQTDPNGDIVLFNPRTKEQIRTGNAAKPEKVSAKGITDEMLGLEDPKLTESRVTGSLRKGVPQMRVRADAIQKFPQFVTDGVFDENKFWRVKAEGGYKYDKETGTETGTGINPSDVYENVPDDFEQRKAAGIAKAMSSQTYRRQQADVLRNIVETYDIQDAKPYVDEFNRLMNSGSTLIAKLRKEHPKFTDEQIQAAFKKERGKQLEAMYARMKASKSQGGLPPPMSRSTFMQALDAKKFTAAERAAAIADAEQKGIIPKQ